jgi:trehalose-6-phosphatase
LSFPAKRGISQSKLEHVRQRVQIAGIAGALLERKRYSVATHYRNVDESDVIEVGRAVIEVAARHRELRKIDYEKV